MQGVLNTLDKRRLASDMGAILVDAVFVICGHRSNLLKHTHRSKKPKEAMKRERRYLAQEAASHCKDATDDLWNQVAMDACSTKHVQSLSRQWILAASRGESGIREWLSTNPKPSRRDIPSSTPGDQQQILDFRTAVSQLDGRCDQDAEMEAAADVRSHINHLREQHESPSCSSSNGGRTTFTTDDVQQCLRKRAERKASSFLPNAAIRACAEDISLTRLVHALMEVVWSTAVWSIYFLTVPLLHIYKGKGLPTNAPSSYRPLGQSHPLLSLGMSLLHDRGKGALHQYCGLSQLGGTKDGRMAAISFGERRALRRELGLPTVEPQADARFGYDGGRHVRFCQGLRKAGLPACEQLLHHDALSHYKPCPIVSVANGSTGLLQAAPMHGGGTIQGLPPSGSIYSTVPLDFELRLRSAVPPACASINEIIAAGFYATYKGDLMVHPQGIDVKSLTALAQRLRAIVSETEHQRLSFPESNAAVEQVFESCKHDGERLWLLDLVGCEEEAPVTLFIDDLACGVSSPDASLFAIGAVHDYGVANGVVFETGHKGKAVITHDCLDAPAEESLRTALEGQLQGGTPRVGESNLLGVPRSACAVGDSSPESIRSSAALLTQSEAKLSTDKVILAGNQAWGTCCSRALAMPFPLLARRYYLMMADASGSYLAPLCIHDPKAGFRLTLLQRKWAISVLHGQRVPKQLPSLPEAAANLLISDLGWTPLWAHTAAMAISMYQGMLHEPAGSMQRNAVHRAKPAAASWVQPVRRIMAKYNVPSWQPATASKSSLSRYRRIHVLPRLRSFLSEPLPWAWIAATLTTRDDKLAFECWFHLRVHGSHHRLKKLCCGLCKGNAEPTKCHLLSQCNEFAAMLGDLAHQRQAFDRPQSPNQFRAVLSVISQLLQKTVTPVVTRT